MKPPPVPDHELPILQPDRARELLEALRGRPFYLIASVALAAGCGVMKYWARAGGTWILMPAGCGWSCRLRRPRLGIRLKAPKTQWSALAVPPHIVTAGAPACQ